MLGVLCSLPGDHGNDVLSVCISLCDPPSLPKFQRQSWMCSELFAVGYPFTPGKHLKPFLWQLILQLHRANTCGWLIHAQKSVYLYTGMISLLIDLCALALVQVLQCTGRLREVYFLIRKLQRLCPLGYINLPFTALSSAVELQVNAWEGGICY